MEYPINYDSPAELREFLESANLSMKKRFGQNFLVNKGGREKIISFLRFSADDSVWEIGPGLGAMTWHLLEGGADVRAFEIDHGFIGQLKEFYGEIPNFSLTEGDFLKNFKKMRDDASASPDYILGNLPYVSGSVMIAEIVRSAIKPSGMVFTLQKEVGHRMAAEPGGKEYSGFSLVCQSKYDVFLRGELKPGSFYPRPAVQSVIVEMRPHNRFEPEDANIYYDLIDDLFLSRRKKISNNLVSGKLASKIGKQAASEALKSSGIDGGRRAETLSVADVELLSRTFAEFAK
ncbi:MAG: 16S rRNA (adenine(1518)-N(6)/adenine(1519)-N(6))-dimethyltransferase RsmA [Spirochaetales bacterium]|uniref:16S rRNA (Adenine(1518)-N(6)/adenine(1519)-N(6))-dimethyltransferase RsmA n=1 Tax=Candidatus Thalassospirochaeta sargassi TaxID=3119039 RepID=A0AAJ1IG49_9SPIO|nr:16S rRNA (adenine(1518)-N(6)/adenine(1519)-N(6))-dimethyltransferase RsmA [Spirochaetales bacterium]